MARIGFDNKGNSWVSYDAGELSEGLGCLIVPFIVIGIITFILSILATVTIKFNYWLNSIFDFLPLKIILFPSVWDLSTTIKDMSIIHIFVLMATFIVIYILAKKIPNDYIKLYLGINDFILVIRIVILIAITVVSLFTETNYSSPDSIKINKYTTDIITSQNVSDEAFHFYTEDEIKEHELMTDSKGKQKYDDVYWVEFNAGDSSNKLGIAEFSYTPDDFYFNKISRIRNNASHFKTTISYIPIEDGYDYTNKSSFKIDFYSDNKLIKTYNLSPKNPIVKVDLDLNAKKSFTVKVKGKLSDISIISFLGTSFSKK